MRIFCIAMLLAMTAHGSGIAASQDMPDDMEKYYMCLARRGPKWTGPHLPGPESELVAHLKYVKKMAASKKLVASGPFTDGGEIAGIFLLRAASMDEAKAIVAEEPWTKAGRIKLDILPWWALKGLGEKYSAAVKRAPDAEVPMVEYQIGFLKRGPKWTPDRAPETDRLQADHLANIGKLAETGKLVVAGPFEGGGDLRGVFLFRVASLDEAKTLSETDPAVKAGRLIIELHPWSVFEGMMP